MTEKMINSPQNFKILHTASAERLQTYNLCWRKKELAEKLFSKVAACIMLQGRIHFRKKKQHSNSQRISVVVISECVWSKRNEKMHFSLVCIRVQWQEKLLAAAELMSAL